MASDVGISCTDCGQQLVLEAGSAEYLLRVRSFVAAHQLCRPHSVVVDVARLPEAARRVPV